MVDLPAFPDIGDFRPESEHRTRGPAGQSRAYQRLQAPVENRMSPRLPAGSPSYTYSPRPTDEQSCFGLFCVYNGKQSRVNLRFGILHWSGKTLF